MKKITLFTLLLTLALVFVGCRAGKKNPLPETLPADWFQTGETAQTPAQTLAPDPEADRPTTDTVGTVPTILEVDPDELVTERYRKEFAGPNGIYVCSIPEINLPGTQITELNEQIFNSLYPAVEAAEKEFTRYEDTYICSEIEYTWAVNGDILSLVVHIIDNDIGCDSFQVYNVSVSQSVTLEDKVVVAEAGMDMAEYSDLAKRVLGTECWQSWAVDSPMFGEQQFVDLFNLQLQSSISDENISEAMPYLNGSGQLCMIAKHYPMAGASYYWHNYNLETDETIPNYDALAVCTG